ncbi:MAG: hypothetical protein R3E08_04910 [Thiotrichaceae bacterium]
MAYGIVPVMIWLYHATFPSDHLMQIAPLNFTGNYRDDFIIIYLRTSNRRQAILWQAVWQLTPGIVVGALLGTWWQITQVEQYATSRFRIVFIHCFCTNGIRKTACAASTIAG